MNLDITHICDHLWQGAHPEDKLPDTINAVVNLCPDDKPRQFQYHSMTDTVLWLPIADGYFPGIEWLDHVVDYVILCEKLRRNVLVHCAAGISRSAMVAIAYVMKTRHLAFIDAIKFVKGRRPKVDPCTSFLAGLLAYEQFLNRDLTCMDSSSSGSSDSSS